MPLARINIKVGVSKSGAALGKPPKYQITAAREYQCVGTNTRSISSI
jgi:hypothetical protein